LEDDAVDGGVKGGFGVPLDGEAEGELGYFNGFDDAVFGDGDGEEAFADLCEGLPVVGGNDDLVGVEPLVQFALTSDADGVRAGFVGLFGFVVDGLVKVGKALVEGAAVGDVDGLDAETDAEDGQSTFACLFIEHEVEALASGVDQFGVGVQRLVVECGVEVEAAGEEDSVEVAEDGSEEDGIVGGYDGDGHGAEFGDGIEVFGVEVGAFAPFGGGPIIHTDTDAWFHGVFPQRGHNVVLLNCTFQEGPRQRRVCVGAIFGRFF